MNDQPPVKPSRHHIWHITKRTLSKSWDDSIFSESAQAAFWCALSLPPLLLIPLVENAFKHGVSETLHQPFVTIQLTATQRRLEFRVQNSTDKLPGERFVKENIGLSNLRRQLELLYTDYQLSVQQGESVFTASLTINLASHV